MNVVAFLEKAGATDYPLSKPDYFRAYKELGAEVEKQGAHFFIARHQSTYQGKGRFSRSWKFEGDALQDVGSIVASVIYDKGKFTTDGAVPVLNCEKINSLCTDKWKMYQHFSDLCPKTWLIHNNKELVNCLALISSDLAVVKPIDGEEGHNVYIEKKSALINRQHEYPLLLQEFLDTSTGIPSVVEGMHDFRVAIIDGEIVYAYYRTPPKGSYLANVARGGAFKVVAKENIPLVFTKIINKVDSEFRQCKHRFYGIDFGLTKQGPRIIEMNSRLGLLPNSDHPIFIELKKNLARTLVNLGKN